MLRINGAVFYSRFDDYQFNFQIPGTIQGSRVFNIDEGDVSGFEMELMVKPTDGLYMQLSYAYLNSNLDNVVNPISGQVESFTFANAPENTFSFVLDYSWLPTVVGRPNVNISYNFVDDRQPENEELHRDDYELINGRFALSDIAALNGQWEIAAWVKNLADNNYVSFALNNLPQASRAVMWGDGRTFGVDISYRYF
jgi:iron complex outermembrane receptor protein